MFFIPLRLCLTADETKELFSTAYTLPVGFVTVSYYPHPKPDHTTNNFDTNRIITLQQSTK